MTCRIYQTAETTATPAVRAKGTAEGNKIPPQREKETIALRENNAYSNEYKLYSDGYKPNTNLS